jgi:hypothetical protein
MMIFGVCAIAPMRRRCISSSRPGQKLPSNIDFYRTEHPAKAYVTRYRTNAIFPDFTSRCAAGAAQRISLALCPLT